MRTTWTSTPLATNERVNAELNCAMPHSVGGWVVRIPIVGGRETCCGTGLMIDDGRADKRLTVNPNSRLSPACRA